MVLCAHDCIHHHTSLDDDDLELEIAPHPEMSGMTHPAGDTTTLLLSRVHIPDHIVRRAFPAETVMLNLRTGQYHGLNPTAGRMLDALEAADSVGQAAEVIARQFGQPLGTIETDMRDLCAALVARGLIEIDLETAA